MGWRQQARLEPCVSCPGQHPTLPTLPPGTGASRDSALLPPTPPQLGDLASTRPNPKFGHSQPCPRDGAKGGAGELFRVRTKKRGGHAREAMTGLAGLGPSVWPPSAHATLPSPRSPLSLTSAETTERQRRKWEVEDRDRDRGWARERRGRHRAWDVPKQ